jgi:hypothetical protein
VPASAAILPAVDHICPLLTLGSDARAVCDAFDADHRCSARGGPESPAREHQLKFCLSEMHAECPHYARHTLETAAPVVAGVPAPSADVFLAPTRLVVDAETGWSGLRSAPAFGPSARNLAAALVLLAAAGGLIATGALHRIPELFAAGADPAGDVSVGILPAPTSSATAAPTMTSTPSPLPTSSPEATPSTTPAAVPSAAPTSEVLAAQSYVVQPGDTLRAIADRFGTTVAVLQQRNGIVDENLIEAGDVLEIR